jgi:uncharacterized protein (UPF0332 family)
MRGKNRVSASKSNKYHHLRHAARSKQLFEQLRNSNNHRFWAVIVAFYLALHVVDALLSDKNKHPRNHKHREKLIKDHLKNVDSNFRTNYSSLKDLATDARYLETSYLTMREPEIETTTEILHESFIPLLKLHSKGLGISIP